jgi:hypothetical protein
MLKLISIYLKQILKLKKVHFIDLKIFNYLVRFFYSFWKFTYPHLKFTCVVKWNSLVHKKLGSSYVRSAVHLSLQMKVHLLVNMEV